MTIEWKDARTHREPKWPFFGFAPGKYMGRCSDCGESCFDMDKRAYRCLPCAMDFASASATSIGEAATKAEKENEILRSAISLIKDGEL